MEFDLQRLDETTDQLPSELARNKMSSTYITLATYISHGNAEANYHIPDSEQAEMGSEDEEEDERSGGSRGGGQEVGSGGLGRWRIVEVEGEVRNDGVGRRRSRVVAGVARRIFAAAGGWWWVEVVVVSTTGTAAGGKWRGRGRVVVAATGSGIGRRRSNGGRRVAGVVAGGAHGAGDADGGWKLVVLERGW